MASFLQFRNVSLLFWMFWFVNEWNQQYNCVICLHVSYIPSGSNSTSANLREVTFLQFVDLNSNFSKHTCTSNYKPKSCGFSLITTFSIHFLSISLFVMHLLLLHLSHREKNWAFSSWICLAQAVELVIMDTLQSSMFQCSSAITGHWINCRIKVLKLRTSFNWNYTEKLHCMMQLTVNSLCNSIYMYLSHHGQLKLLHVYMKSFEWNYLLIDETVF